MPDSITAIALAPLALVDLSAALAAQTPPGCTSLAFDGIDDCVVVPFDDEFVSQSFTVSIWIRQTGPLAEERGWVFTTGEDPNSDILAWGLNVTAAGFFEFVTEANSSAQPTFSNSGVFVADGAWHHLAAAGSPDGGVSLWVDGVLALDNSSAPPIVTTVEQNLTIGCIFGVDGGAQMQPPTQFFNGGIDEVSYWTRRLNGTEIEALAAGGLPADTSGLEAYWRFDEGAGQVVADETGGDDGLLGGDSAVQGTDPTWKSFPLDVPATETVRPGEPANPIALVGGSSGGPAIGSAWDPRVDHSAFAPNAFSDVLILGATPTNTPLPGVGTLLVDLLGFTLLGPVAPGASFQIAVPDDCAIVGVALSAQAAAVTPSGLLATNALDVTIGTP